MENFSDRGLGSKLFLGGKHLMFRIRPDPDQKPGFQYFDQATQMLLAGSIDG